MPAPGNHNDPKEFGRCIRKLRKANGYNLEKLAEQSGLSRTTVWRIEKGLQEAKLSTLRALAMGLEMELCVLMSHFQGGCPLI